MSEDAVEAQQELVRTLQEIWRPVLAPLVKGVAVRIGAVVLGVFLILLLLVIGSYRTTQAAIAENAQVIDQLQQIDHLDQPLKTLKEQQLEEARYSALMASIDRLARSVERLEKTRK